MKNASGFLDGLVFVIPAYNESATIRDVVFNCKQRADVIVVDDGSTDNSVEIALGSGALVETHFKNLGYEFALETGILRAAELGYQYVITLDGDGQHSMGCIEEIHEKLKYEFEVVCGNRDRRQRISEHIFSLFGRLSYGIQDPLCGLKGYRLNLKEVSTQFNTFRSIGTELLFKIAKRGGLVGTVFVKTFPRADSSRFGGVFKANARIFKALVAVAIFCIKK